MGDTAAIAGRHTGMLGFAAIGLAMTMHNPLLEVPDDPDDFINATIITPDCTFTGAGGKRNNRFGLEITSDPEIDQDVCAFIVHLFNELTQIRRKYDIRALAQEAFDQPMYCLVGEITMEDVQDEEAYNAMCSDLTISEDLRHRLKISPGQPVYAAFCTEKSPADEIAGAPPPNDIYCEVLTKIDPRDRAKGDGKFSSEVFDTALRRATKAGYRVRARAAQPIIFAS